MLRKVAERVLVVIFGLLIAILLAETAVRLLYIHLPMGLQIALRDVKVVPFSDSHLAPPSLWQADTDYQTIVRPGAIDSLQAGSPSVTFHVTSYAWWGGRVGFRSPQPQDGNVQAVALGDSFTFCFTELSDCWVTLVSQRTGLPISNLGQPVTGSTSHARLYDDFVAKPDLKLAQPRLVLWEFYGNDFNDDYGLAALDGTARTPPLAQSAPPPASGAIAKWLRENSALYVIAGSLLRGKQAGVDEFVDPDQVALDGLDLWFGQSYIRDAFDLSQPRNLEGVGLSEQAILWTRARVEKNGGNFVVLVFPAKEEVYRPLTEPVMGKAAVDAIAAPRLSLLEFCAAQKLNCLDLLPILSPWADDRQQIYYPTDPHLNALGNHVIAEAIGDFLQRRGLLGFTF
ncbi:MAG TPA: hypothetical protein VKQ72_04970 [Aggregatilineales bacterium]|nr:hypothetical protein [Aggregatilineales bacterium]